MGRSKRQLSLATFCTLVFLACGCGGGPVEDHQEKPVNAGFPIHYVVRGQGEPVILVHGFSQTHRAWHQVPIFEALKDYQIITVDLRGHGNSKKPHHPRSYGRNMEQDIVYLLDRLEIARAHFIGFSLGASVIGGLLVSNPERVQTATLGSGYFTVWSEQEEDFARRTAQRSKTDERFPWEPENQDFQALAALIRGTEFAVIEDSEISSISTPALVSFGSLEMEAMEKSQRRRLNGRPSSIQLLVIEGADHDKR